MPCGHELVPNFNMLYCILRVYKYTREHNQQIMMTSITNEYTFLQKYKFLTLYFRKVDVCCVWETRTDCYIDPSSSLNHSSTSFASWLGLLNWGSLRAQSPQSAAGSHFGILSLTEFELPGHLVILFSNAYLLLLFFCLFTQVPLLIDSSVKDQYITFVQVG